MARTHNNFYVLFLNLSKSFISLPFVLFVLIAFSVRASLIDFAHIPSSSMEPTLNVGDMVVVDKRKYGLRIPLTNIYIYRFDTPAVGEVVTFKGPEPSIFNSWIKRIIAKSGDRISIVNKSVYVNGKALQCDHRQVDNAVSSCEEQSSDGTKYRVKWLIKPHIKSDHFNDFIVPDNHVFLLGDNRNNSFDSRFIGSIHIDDIYGRHTYTLKDFTYLHEIIMWLLVTCLLIPSQNILKKIKARIINFNLHSTKLLKEPIYAVISIIKTKRTK